MIYDVVKVRISNSLIQQRFYIFVFRNHSSYLTIVKAGMPIEVVIEVKTEW